MCFGLRLALMFRMGIFVAVRSVFQFLGDIHPTPVTHRDSVLVYITLANAVPTFICAIKIGLGKQATATVSIANKVTKWPEKVGELLASMYAFGSINTQSNLQDVRIFPAFRWKPSTYESQIGTIFTNVMNLRISPFYGMTDVLLVGKSIAVIRAVSVRICKKALNSHSKMLTFNLEKSLPTPVLCTGVVYYKQQLWTYNLGIHNSVIDRACMHM